jgi:FkbM family methyltransferase
VAQFDLIYDIGLHKGEDAAFYLAKGYRVVAFEADPDLSQKARKRFARDIESGRFTLVEGAIAPPGSGEHVTFYRNIDRSVWGTVDAERADLNARMGKRSVPITVRTVDLAKVVDEHGAPFYAKIDIEGADQIARDALLSHPSKPDYLSCESDKLDLDAVAAELDALRDAGFTRFQVVQQAFIPGRRIKSRTLSGKPLAHQFADGASGPFGEELGGAWLTRDQTIESYRKIFKGYELWGDKSLARRILTEVVLDRIGRLTRRGLPGWYDTHARFTG